MTKQCRGYSNGARSCLQPEEDERRWVAYNAVVAERDKLAEEITRNIRPLSLSSSISSPALPQTTNSARSATGMPVRCTGHSLGRGSGTAEGRPSVAGTRA